VTFSLLEIKMIKYLIRSMSYNYNDCQQYKHLASSKS
jgi:hypothetical protein